MKNKEKVIIFLIGLLVGAVIASGAFLLYSKCNNGRMHDQMPGGTPPGMTGGQNGQPPEMSNGQNGQPPAKPGESNSKSSYN